MSEQTRLDHAARFYGAENGLYQQFGGMHQRMIAYDADALAPFFRGQTALELGIGDGEMTGHLLRHFAHVTGVDGAAAFVAQVRDRYAMAGDRLLLVESLFEAYEPRRQFDTVLLLHILEHVDDPIALLRRAAQWVAPGGVLIALVPNATSLHRMAAVKLGLLDRPESLGPTDVSLGHRRVYDPQTFQHDITAAGLTIAEFGGVFLKPLSNGQIDRDWSPDLIDAYYQLGKDFPALASEIFVICPAH